MIFEIKFEDFMQRSGDLYYLANGNTFDLYKCDPKNMVILKAKKTFEDAENALIFASQYLTQAKQLIAVQGERKPLKLIVEELTEIEEEYPQEVEIDGAE